jgi:hypothetical protein
VDFLHWQHLFKHYSVNTNKFQPFWALYPLDR